MEPLRRESAYLFLRPRSLKQFAIGLRFVWSSLLVNVSYNAINQHYGKEMTTVHFCQRMAYSIIKLLLFILSNIIYSIYN